MKGLPTSRLGMHGQECRQDFAAFCHQNVVGATSSWRGHAFQPDASGGDLACEPGVQKSLLGACTQNHQVRFGLDHGLKVFGADVLPLLRAPSLKHAFRHDQKAPLSALVIDGDPIVTISRNRV